LAGLRRHGTKSTFAARFLLFAVVLSSSLALLAGGATAGASGKGSGGGFLSVGQPQVATTLATLPANFQESVVFSGLDRPTAVRFASDGRVFVAEKRGLIKVFDNLSDTTPTVFADLRTNTHDFWDRGMLGLALDPNFPTAPYVYVSYTYDAPPGRPRRCGTTRARHRPERRPTGAWSQVGCRG
jgi:glucose/arabinose dehydrogenase